MANVGYSAVRRALREAGEYLDERGEDADARAVISAVNLALEEEREVVEVLEEVLPDE